MNIGTENAIIKKDSSKSGVQSYAQFLKAMTAGTVIAIFASIILLLLFAVIINSSFGDPDSVLNVFTIVAASAGALIGGFYASRSNGGRGLLCGLSTGASISITLLAVMIFTGTFESENSSVTFRFMMILFQIIFACFGGILAVNTRRQKKTSYYPISRKK